MADEKKSFLLYADITHTVKHLTLEQKGELFTHILDYVNDENPKTENPIINIAFEPIRQSLKRDLVKYNCMVKKRSLAGIASAEARAKKSTNSTRVKSVEHNPTNPTDSVSDSDSDSVILLEKETKGIFKDWIDYRKEIKKPIKSEKTKISLAKKIQAAGYIKSKKVIETSISNGWQGLFWDSNENVKYLNNEKQPTINRQTAETIRSNSEGWTVNRN